jgi:hypothetical protein
VSFGTNIKRPDLLETRSARDLLLGIRGGEWRGAVEKVRSLPPDSSLQRRAKTDLPYALWSGQFSRRDSSALVKHSGLIGVDLDHLDTDATRTVMHAAMDDPFCAAAFRSARGEGVRLIFRGPDDVTAAGHGAVFDASADYVREHYQVEPDAAGRDVCRASFVSFDGGLWLNPEAQILPVQTTDRPAGVNTMVKDHCVNLLAVPWWVWMAREHLPHRQKPGGTALTHYTLLRLGRRLALRIERERAWPVVDDVIEDASAAWLREASRRGLKLRGSPAEYGDELRGIVAGVRKRTWFTGAARVWVRWTQERDFPKGDSKAGLLFAIRGHCRESRSRIFFISCRDAATITGSSHVSAWHCLNQLCADGKIRRVKVRRLARQACSFELLPGEKI